MSNHVLSMLGLAKRGGMLVVGEEPVEAVTRARDARLLLLASDAADNTQRRCTHFAEMGQCLWLRLPFTKEEVGMAMGRTSCALLALTDVGFAAAIAHRLALLDGPQYAATAQKLDVKAKRAAERRNEQRSHEKNVRLGRVKKKPIPVPTPPPPKAEAERAKPPSSAPRPAPRRAASGASSDNRRPQRPKSEFTPSRGSPHSGGRTGPDRTGPSRTSPGRPGPGRTGPGRKQTAAGTGFAKRRPPKDQRSAPKRPDPYAHSKPVKKGKGSFPKKDV